MSSIHIREIEKLLRARDTSFDGFIEIRFDEQTWIDGVIDDETRNKVLTFESPQGA